MGRGRRDKAVSPEEAEKSQGAKMRIKRQKKGISLTELAKSLGYTKGYLSTVETGRILPPPMLIKQYEEALLLQPDELIGASETSEQQTGPAQRVSTDEAYNQQKDNRKEAKEDWGEAPIVAAFYGREQELDILKRWIVIDKCQIVALLGLGGIGKSTLAVSAAGRVQGEFEYIFWRSLQNAPAVEDILKGCLQFLPEQERTEVPGNFNEQILLLIQILQEHRCLIVLDNLEVVLEGGEDGDESWERSTNYTILLQRIGEVKHQSCFLLTSREKPKEIALLEARTMPVKSMPLTGLEKGDAQKILGENGVFGSADEYERLASFYSGNPLALRLVSKFIQEFFNGNVTAFIEEGELVLGDVHDLLSQHFARLSEVEQEILCWLAIEREGVSIDDLEEDLVRPPSRRNLIEAIASLQRRFLIEKKDGARFSLQPVIMEYMTDRLVEQVYEEIDLRKIDQLDRYALIKAQAVEYVRNTQVRLILEPISSRLLKALSKDGCEEHLKSIVADLRESQQQTTGYAAGNLLNLLIHINGNLREVDFSHLTIKQAYLQGVSLPQVNFAHVSFAQSVFSDTFGSILAVALSSDNKYLAAGTAHGTVRLWYVTTGTVLRIFEGHSNWVRTVAFSPDGRLLASAGDDQTIRLWDVGSGRCLRILSEHSNRVRMVIFSSDGHLLISSSDDQTIRFWDVKSGECLKVLKGHEHRVRTVALSPDGCLLVSGSDDQTIRFWDVKSGECLKVLKEHDCLIRVLVFNPDGDLLASGGEDQTIRLWDVESGECLNTLTEHTNAVRSVVFYADGDRFISGSDDQTIRFWETRSGRCLKTIQGYSNWITSVAFSPDGSWLASGSQDRSIQLWRLDNDKYVKVLKDHHGLVYSVAFNSDGTLLASGSQDNTVRLWDVDSGQCLKVLHGHTNQVNSVAFNRQGNLLASGSEDNTVRLWDVHSGQCSGILQGHENRVRSVAFNSNDTLLASGSEDNTICLWEVGSGRCLNILRGHRDQVRAVAFSPDGVLLASGSEDNTIRLWEVSSGRCLMLLQGHRNRVKSVIFSLEGSLLISGSEDTTIGIWEVESGHLLRTLQGHHGLVYSVALKADGETLASGSYDGTVKLWNIYSSECLKTLQIEGPYEGMNITGIKGLTLHQKDTLKMLGAIEEEGLSTRYIPSLSSNFNALCPEC